MSLFAGIVGDIRGNNRWEHLQRLSSALDGPGAANARNWRSLSAMLVHRLRCFTAEDRWERQPLAGGRTVLMFDGRLDNREELAEALGIGIAGVPDSGVVLAALERWGDDAVSRLLGPFALAWWDNGERRLLLARDPLGHRTVYYTDTPDGFAFATTPRALLALPDVPRRVDEAAVAAFLVDLSLSPGASFFDTVQQVPAAHFAVWQAGRFEARRYWEPDYSRRLNLRHDDDYAEAARDHLTSAVRRCLRTDRPIATQLTGGLDSTAVATTAARMLAPARLMTLTAAPGDGLAVPAYRSKFVGEGCYVQATAALYDNMDVHLVPGSAVQRFESEPERLFLTAGLPLRNIMNVGWFGPTHERARSAGVGVLLTGVGGNLTLGWDGLPGLRDAARSGQVARVWRELPPLARALDIPVARLWWSTVLRPLLPFASPQWFDRLRGRPEKPWLRNSAIHPAFAEMHQVDEPARRLRGFGRHGEEQMRRLLLSRHQANSQLRSAFRNIHGFDQRNPLCDLRLLEFCFAVPNDQYLRNGVTRWLARRVLAGQAPPEVVNNFRRGAQAPEFLHRLAPRRAEFLATIEELERSPLARRCLDLPRLKTLAHTLPTEPAEEHFTPYVAVLDRGLHIGRFIRWVEGGNG